MRRYLVREFGLTPNRDEPDTTTPDANPKEATSAEIRAGLAPVEWLATSDAHGQISEWLADCDLIKFAGAHASPDDAQTLYQGALTIVAETSCEPADGPTSTAASSPDRGVGTDAG